ncbi:MAG: GAF domain-containing protein, partial [Cyanobacteria bacterium J06635_11]
AMIGVPIFVANQWWGVLAFDDCTAERVWTEAEIAVLETAAACLGSAIERDRTRQDHEAAAQVRAAELEAHNQALEGRDRILQAMAAASNVLLTEDDFDLAVNTALRILGESVGCDRIGVGQQHDDPTGETLGFVRFLYEWDSLGTSAQLTDHEGLADFPWQALGMAAWFAANIKGEAFGRVIDDLPEPFRGLQQQVNVQSTHNIPIFVEGRFWGVFGIDHCREKKLLSETELAAFKTAANCFGSAIERNRAIKARAAELEQHNQTLAERDRILEATAAAANVMLTADDFDSAVNTALKIVGEGLGVDRVILGEYFTTTNQQSPGYHQFLYEWTSPGTTSQIKHPELARVSDSGIEFAIDTVRRGEIFGGVVEELSEPFRSGQLELGVKSTYSVPIKVENSFWGVIGFDDCHKLTRRSEAELEALKTLANCIGNAIERDLTIKAREATEREMIVARERAARAAELEAANQVLVTRDRWLETTAAAASELLSATDASASVEVALATIGRNLECDRVSVMQHILAPDAPAGDLGLMKILYEWDAEGIRSQCEDPDLREIPSDGVEDWFKRVMAGHWVGGLIGVLKDPFRSSMQ